MISFAQRCVETDGDTMYSIDELLNRIGIYELETDSGTQCFSGFLMMQENQVVLKTSLKGDHLDIDCMECIDIIYGSVGDADVTLINSYEIQGTISRSGNELVHEYVLYPDCIIIGRKHSRLPFVKAKVNLPNLARFFTDSIIDSSSCSGNNNVLVRYKRCDPIIINEDLADIHVCRDLGQVERINKSITLEVYPTIEVDFHKPMELYETIGYIFKIKNLLTYFKDEIIEIREIQLADEESPEKPIRICDLTAILNNAVETPTRNERFHIQDIDIKEKENEIWKKWDELYEHKFITLLYQEVISNKSMGINAFLNYSQAVELYENTFRNDSIEKNKYGEGKFKSCIKDAIQELNDVLELDSGLCEDLAESIKNARNYFTHYNKKNIEPSSFEVFALSRIMHFILLGLVYRKLGIDTKPIKDMLDTTEFKGFKRDVDIALRKPVPYVHYDSFF